MTGRGLDRETRQYLAAARRMTPAQRKLYKWEIIILKKYKWTIPVAVLLVLAVGIALAVSEGASWETVLILVLAGVAGGIAVILKVYGVL